MAALRVEPMRVFFATLGLCAMQAIAAPPARVTIEFAMSQNGVTMVEVRDQLLHDQGAYSITSEAKASGVFALAHRGKVRLTSQGRVSGGRLQPQLYRDERSKRPTLSARFDWQRRSVSQGEEASPREQALPPGTQDRLSFLYHFAFAGLPAGELSITTADGRDLDTRRYRVLGEARVRVPAGEFDCVHLLRLRDGADDRTLELWLARSHAWLPVRIVQVEPDGKRVEQVATRIAY